MSTKYTVGQMNQLGDALEAADYSPDDVTKLRTSTQLTDFKRVLFGQAEIKILEYMIDCDANPFVPNGWTVEEHQKGGKFKWNPEQVKLYLSETQSNGKIIGGRDLRKDLAGKPLMNACVLDYLLAHPELIPEDWKGRHVFFWGTIYRSLFGSLYVRYLDWHDGQWQWNDSWLDSVWVDGDPAALRASLPAEASA